jgi:hypothetical protein
MFSVFYRGKVARVFAPHLNCSGVNPYPKGIFTDEFHDVAVMAKCPDRGTHALNITFVPDIRLGDDVILYGEGDIANVWKGVLSGNRFNPAADCGLSTPWYPNTSICNGEYLIQSHQHDGLSGSPVANGCGFVGMAHAIMQSGAIFAAVINGTIIRKLINKFFSKLPNIEDCEDVSVVNLPHYPFSDCVAKEEHQSLYYYYIIILIHFFFTNFSTARPPQ